MLYIGLISICHKHIKILMVQWYEIPYALIINVREYRKGNQKLATYANKHTVRNKT